jgi:hypothetical protein
MRYSDWEQRQMDIKSGEELDRRTATVRINVPKERYWPKGWERPAEYPTFQAVEIGDNRLGMEVRQDGAWVRLPDQAALHIRVMTVQVGESRDECGQLREALRQSLRQWKMYAENDPDRDMKTEASTEAKLYRAHLALAERT